jgi:hypothetical protein
VRSNGVTILFEEMAGYKMTASLVQQDGLFDLTLLRRMRTPWLKQASLTG